jgi:hypothetical protein
MSNLWYVNPQMLRRSEMGGDVAVVLEVHLAEALRQAEYEATQRRWRGEYLYEQGQRDVLAAARRVLTDEWYAMLESEVLGGGPQ